jgi:hypothetical protein
MNGKLRTAHLRQSLQKISISVSGLAFICLLCGPLLHALAQNVGNVDPNQATDWAPGAINHAQKMRIFKDPVQGSQATPPTIPKLEVDADPSGSVATFQPGGPRALAAIRSSKI